MDTGQISDDGFMFNTTIKENMPIDVHAHPEIVFSSDHRVHEVVFRVKLQAIRKTKIEETLFTYYKPDIETQHKFT